MEPTLRITRDVVRTLEPSLLSVARRALQRPEDAEDVVQEMWLGAIHAASRFEGRSSVRTWLTSILKRRISERYRRKKTALPFDEEAFESELDDAHLQVANAELAAEVIRRLPTLGDAERTALMLTTLGGFERDEACEQLGITRGHLRVLLHRARKKLEVMETEPV